MALASRDLLRCLLRLEQPNKNVIHGCLHIIDPKEKFSETYDKLVEDKQLDVSRYAVTRTVVNVMEGDSLTIRIYDVSRDETWGTWLGIVDTIKSVVYTLSPSTSSSSGAASSKLCPIFKSREEQQQANPPTPLFGYLEWQTDAGRSYEPNTKRAWDGIIALFKACDAECCAKERCFAINWKGLYFCFEFSTYGECGFTVG